MLHLPGLEPVAYYTVAAEFPPPGTHLSQKAFFKFFCNNSKTMTASGSHKYINFNLNWNHLLHQKTRSSNIMLIWIFKEILRAWTLPRGFGKAIFQFGITILHGGKWERNISVSLKSIMFYTGFLELIWLSVLNRHGLHSQSSNSDDDCVALTDSQK